MSDSGTDVGGTTIELGEIRKTLKKSSFDIIVESRENEEFYFGWVLGRGWPLYPFAHQIARVVPLVYIFTWHVWSWLYHKSKEEGFFLQALCLSHLLDVDVCYDVFFVGSDSAITEKAYFAADTAPL